MEIGSQINNIIDTIKEYRNKKGYSHETMGHQLDISPSAYNKIERKETKLTVERMFLIQDILEIPTERLFQIENIKTVNQNNYDNSVGFVEKYHQENKDLYKDLLAAKDDVINQLKKRLEDNNL